MRCPVCKTVSLADATLEEGLASHACGKCGGQGIGGASHGGMGQMGGGETPAPRGGGQWIGGQRYGEWVQMRGGKTDAAGGDEQVSAPVRDSTAAKLCPECGRFLIRHKVGHGVDFCIDRCTACGGIWLDANEWQTL